MNRFFTLLCAASCLTASWGQCDADFDFNGVPFGISPDSQLGETFADGTIGQSYSETIHFAFPSSLADVPGSPITSNLDSVIIEDIVLVDEMGATLSVSDIGLTLSPNNNGVSSNPNAFLGGDQYCADLTGIPTMTGVFTAEITTTAWLALFGIPLNIPFEFDGYTLSICSSPSTGCTDENACNYICGATIDDGSCTYILDGACDCDGNVLDECGICGGEGIAEGACDCAGNVLDCNGVCGGGADIDECGICGGNNSCYCFSDFAAELTSFDVVECPEDFPLECDSNFGSSFDTLCGGGDTLLYDCITELSLDCYGGWYRSTYLLANLSQEISHYAVQDMVAEDSSAPTFEHAEAEFDYAIELNEATVNCQLSLPLPCLNIVDNCDCFNPWYPGCSEPEFPSGTVTLTEVVDTLANMPGVYNVQRVWTAVDASGNASNYHQTIFVKDSLNTFEPFEDENANGICDFLEESGCTDLAACNYNPSVSFDDGSCLVLDVIGECGGTCQSDYNNNGICDDQEVNGCTYILAENFDSDATDDDGSCIFPCEGVVNTNIFDWDGDYVVTVTDFLMMLSVYGDTDVDLDGVWDSEDLCADTDACNFDLTPTEACLYVDALGVCGGDCGADEDADGICDDVDTCVGIEDECGVCNGPGPTEAVIDDIIITYDSIYLPVDEEWFVYAVNVDTTYGYLCAPSFNDCGDQVSYEGYDYATVLIGNQCWFAENLRSENYNNGDAIPSNLNDTLWEQTSIGAVAVYGEWSNTCSTFSPDGDACDEAWSLSEYGRLYNWYAVDDARGLCPSGWHVPSDGEWTVMTEFLGGDSVAGSQMKATYGWANSGNGTNSSGFSGLPSGYRGSDGSFNVAGYYGDWWSSTPNGDSKAWIRALNNISDYVLRNDFGNQRYGFSVRCVRDAE